MRIPLAISLESRDGTTTKDARINNGLIEVKGDQSSVRRRPTLTDIGLVKTGTAQLLENWKGIRSVIGDYFCSGYAPSAGYTNNTTWNSADKAGTVTLSGGDLTFTTTAAGGRVRSIASISSGFWYYEVTVNTLGNLGVGFAGAGATLGGAGDYNFAIIYYNGAGGALYGAAGTTVYVDSFTVGDKLGCFADVAGKTIVFSKNGVTLGSLSGADFPSGAIYAYGGGIGAAVAAGTANFAGPFTYTPASTQVALTTATANMPYQSAFSNYTAATQYLMIKNADNGWTIPVSGTPTKIADADYPGNYSPARQTVPGIVYLDGYFLVMDTYGRVYNSAIDDPTNWTALGYLTAQNEPGNAVALGKTQNYAVALKEYSTELLYDAANPVGSPLSPVDNGFLKVGCASGTSVVTWNESLIWISQSKQEGRGVYVLRGIQPQKISTPDVERILNKDNLFTVYAYAARLDGHDLYILTLVTSNITLVYDFSSNMWSTWSSLTATTTFKASSITRVNQDATVVTQTPHGMSDGDPVYMTGWNQAEYNGYFQISYVDASTFKIKVYGSPATPGTTASSVTCTPYIESYFKFTKYVNYSGYDLVLHETDGHLYYFLPGGGQDNLIPVNFALRTQRLDGGSNQSKKNSSITLVCDAINSYAMIRWADDDYATPCAYKFINQYLQKPQFRRAGSFRRRSYELRYTGQTAPRLNALELEITQ